MTNTLSATGKTLEEIDALFARSPEVRERLEKEIAERRARGGATGGPMGRRASLTSITNDKMGVSNVEKVESHL